MAKVKTLIRHFDLENKKTREVNDLFDVTEPRLSYLESLGFVKRTPGTEESKQVTKATAKTTRKPKKVTPEA